MKIQKYEINNFTQVSFIFQNKNLTLTQDNEPISSSILSNWFAATARLTLLPVQSIVFIAISSKILADTHWDVKELWNHLPYSTMDVV